jgi:hypothetical protein
LGEPAFNERVEVLAIPQDPVPLEQIDELDHGLLAEELRREERSERGPSLGARIAALMSSASSARIEPRL